MKFQNLFHNATFHITTASSSPCMSSIDGSSSGEEGQKRAVSATMMTLSMSGWFKQSCEACGKAKIRCSSEVPQCGRCARKGLVCVYEAEMKRGRKATKRGFYQGFEVGVAMSPEIKTQEFVPCKKVSRQGIEAAARSDMPRMEMFDVDMQNQNPETQEIKMKRGVPQESPRQGVKSNDQNLLHSSQLDLDFNRTKPREVLKVLEMYRIEEVEKKIFQAYFVLHKHATEILLFCPCQGNLPFSHSKFQKFLENTAQTERYFEIANGSSKGWDEIERRLGTSNVCYQNSMIPNGSAASSQALLDSFFAVSFGNQKLGEKIHKMSDSGSKTPYIRLDYLPKWNIPSSRSSPTLSSMALHCESDENIPVSGKQNQAFTDIFGFTLIDIRFLQQYFQGEILPWGGDIIALLSQGTEHTIRYLHQFAICFEATQEPLAVFSPGFHMGIIKETKFTIDSMQFRTKSERILPTMACDIVFRQLILPDGSIAGSQLHICMLTPQLAPSQAGNM